MPENDTSCVERRWPGAEEQFARSAEFGASLPMAVPLEKQKPYSRLLVWLGIEWLSVWLNSLPRVRHQPWLLIMPLPLIFVTGPRLARCHLVLVFRGNVRRGLG